RLGWDDVSGLVFSRRAGGSFAVMNEVYCMSLVLNARKYVHASTISFGVMNSSSVARASTLAPAVAPLCAIGVAIAIALDQLCPGSPGMFEGKRSVTVGTTQETSPMSSEPPLIGRRTGP